MRRWDVLILPVSLMGLDPAAFGADAPTDPAVETVVVSAERRPHAAADDPPSVDVLDAGALDERSANNLGDLATILPGFGYTSNTVIGQPFIRGLGSQLTGFGTDSSIATYVDGVYQTQPIDLQYL